MSAEATGGKQPSAPLGAVSSEIVRLIEAARESVVQVRNGRRGAGAGVIWDAKGLVLTNAHVVAQRSRDRGRNASTTVMLRDGRNFGAEIVKSDRALDLALLRLEGSLDDLPAARFGDSEALRVGELVFAIGNPWGRLGAATAGIVSGRPRAGRRGGRVSYVRSDVALAPGNSGGPLLSARGEVVGINAMIFGGTALSIPGNMAAIWAVEPQGGGRPRLGVRVQPARLPNPMRGVDLPEVGLVVAAVEGGSPADRAGLMVGDVLVGVAGDTLPDAGSLLGALARGGDAVTLRVIRGSDTSDVDVSLGASGPERAA